MPLYVKSLLFFALAGAVYCGKTGKTDNLFKALEKSSYRSDIQNVNSNVVCNPCKTTITFKSLCQYSNLMRHFTSEQHKAKAKWSVEEAPDGTFKIVSTVQKTTLLQFWKPTWKPTPSTSSKSTFSSIQDKQQTFSLPTLIVSNIIHKESKEMSTQRGLEMAKSRELIKNILTEERIYFTTEGQQNLQLVEQITSSMDRLQSTFCQKVEFMLSKLNYMDYIPKIFLSNLLRLSTQISADLEKSENTQQELIQIAESFVIQQYKSLLKITTKENEIRKSCSVNDILCRVKQSVWTESDKNPDLILKLSILMEKDSFLSIFLRDLFDNMDRRRPVWSETTLSMFSLLLNYGGPATAELVNKNFGGPQLSTIYIKSRQSVQVENILKREALSNAAVFYQKILPDSIQIKDIIFTLAIDATPILPLVRARGNTLIGFATEHKIEISSANDIIQIFKDKDFTTAQQSYVFILTPLRSDIPYYILAAPPVIKGESHVTVKTWIQNIISLAKMYDINISGLGADGDSKVRAYYLQKFSTQVNENRGQSISIEREDFCFYLPKNENNQQVECAFPDPRHLIKKWRNQILNVRRLLIFGKHLVQLEHLMKIADNEKYKHSLDLWKTDIKVSDKQNVNAAIRLFDPKVQECLNDCDEQQFKGTVCYLQLGTMLNKMYFDKHMHISIRIRYAWTLVQFLRLWKIWTELSKYKTDKNFISDQTFKDVLIASHSLILFAKYHFKEKSLQPFEPWTWGSNACEEVFSKARCFVRTKNNFCHAEFLDICRRLQKVAETEKNPNIKTRNSIHNDEHTKLPNENDIQDIDCIIKEEIQNGDQMACKMAFEVEMHQKLLSSKILARSENCEIKICENLGNINLKNIPSTENGQDELKLLTNDEIESLNDREIILTALCNDHQSIHSADLMDIACDITSGKEFHTDPTMNPSGSPPISISSEECHDFTHPVCQAKTSSYSETNEMDKSCSYDDVLPLTSSKVSEKITNLENKPEHIDTRTSKQDGEKSTHVFYQGRWFHINRLVSWEQGKFYMPKQARLTRFYSNYAVFDKFIMDKSKNPTSVSHDFYIAAWDKGKYKFGIVRRIIRLPVRGKSALPIFHWEKNSDTQDVDLAIQVMIPEEINNKHGLSRKLCSSNTFEWISAKEYVTNLQGRPEDGDYIIEDDCFTKLQTVLVQLIEQDELEEKKETRSQ